MTTSKNFLHSLNLDETIYEKGNLIVINQIGNVEGSFIFHYILADYISRFDNDFGVFLILNHNKLSHWDSINSKRGIDFKKMQEKGQLIVMDILQLIYKNQLEEESSSKSIITQNGNLNFEIFLSECESKLSQFGTKKILFVIEDLSQLNFEYPSVISNELDEESYYSSTLYQNRNDIKIIEFLRKIQSFSVLKDIRILSLANSIQEIKSLKLTKCLTTISNVLSNLTFEVKPLKTGLSDQVNGTLTLKSQPNPMNQHNNQNRWMKSFHFKLDDKLINFYPL